MRKGAILQSSIELIYQIIESNKKPKLEIKKYTISYTKFYKISITNFF